MIPQSPEHDFRTIITRYAPHLISAALLLVMAVNLLTVTARKSITIDETLVIPAGYYQLKTGAFHLASEHPPFPLVLSALPLLFLPLQTPSLDDVRDEPSAQQTLVAAD